MVPSGWRIEAKKIIDQANDKGITIPLPEDVVCAKTFAEDAEATTKSIDDIADDDMILDVGPKTAETIKQYLLNAKTIVWNGPLGVFEFESFSQGTKTLSEAIAQSSAFSIAGGGDTVAAVSQFGIEDDVSYISTGGGAFLEFLEGKKLPAIAILEECARAWEAMERAREF